MRKFAVVVICVLVSLSSAVGQSTFGTIVGVVHDQTDAAVAGAVNSRMWSSISSAMSLLMALLAPASRWRTSAHDWSSVSARKTILAGQ